MYLGILLINLTPLPRGSPNIGNDIPCIVPKSPAEPLLNGEVANENNALGT